MTGRPPAHRLVDVGQAAAYLGVGQRMVRRLVAERRVRFCRVGRHVRLDVVDLARFLAVGAVEPVGSADEGERQEPVGRDEALEDALRAALERSAGWGGGA